MKCDSTERLGAMCFGEFLGTFLLVTMIFALTEGCNVGRPSDTIAPVFIWATSARAHCRQARGTRGCKGNRLPALRQGRRENFGTLTLESLCHRYHQ